MEDYSEIQSYLFITVKPSKSSMEQQLCTLGKSKDCHDILQSFGIPLYGAIWKNTSILTCTKKFFTKHFNCDFTQERRNCPLERMYPTTDKDSAKSEASSSMSAKTKFSTYYCLFSQ